jgi:hypothetical protein
MKNQKGILSLLILTLLSFFPSIHFAFTYLKPAFVKISFGNLFLIYLFIGLLTIAHLIGIRPMLKRWPKQAGMMISGLNLIKMIISLALLLLVIFPIAGKNTATALNFTVVYFYLLGIESFIIVKFLIPGKPLIFFNK